MAVKLSLKRGRDDDMMGLHQSPLVRCAGPQLSSPRSSPSQFNLDANPTKRARRSDYTSSTSRVQAHFQNFFPLQDKDVSEKVSDIVRTSSNVNRRKQKQKEGEKMFTLEEVKEIVAKAVAEREEEIRLEYTDILSRRLQGFSFFPLLLFFLFLSLLPDFLTLISFFFFFLFPFRTI